MRTIQHRTTCAGLAMLLLLALNIFSAPGTGQAAPQPAGRLASTAVCSGGISGAVTASDTGAPLLSVSVTATLVGSDFAKTAETDASGHYTIGGLPGGEYQVQFKPDPADQTIYLGEYYNGKSQLSDATLVQVASGAITPGINAALDVGGTISGVITGASAPGGLGDVLVNIYTSAGEPAGETFTDISGAYTTDALPSGSYKLEFVPPHTTQPYLSEFFSNQTDLATSSVVAVTAPNNTPNINATLDLGGQIRGRVTAANGGAGLANVAVSIYTSDDQFVDAAFTDALGDYASGGLRAGSYKLLFNPSDSDTANAYLEEFYNHKPDRASASLVTVTVPNPTTANTTLSAGGQFAGKVTAAGSDVPLADIQVQIYSTDGQLVATTSTDASGNYLTQGLAQGSYKVLFDPSQSAAATGYAYEYSNNKPTFALADLVAAPAPGATAQINAALDPGGRISGNIALNGTDRCGNPFDIQDAQITIYDSSGQPVATTRPSATGDYTTPALPTGIYRIGFEGPAGTGFVPAFYRDTLTLEQATTVGVTAPNTTPNINASLNLARSIFLPLIRW